MKLVATILLLLSHAAFAGPSVCDTVFSRLKLNIIKTKSKSVFVVTDEALPLFNKARRTKQFKQELGQLQNKRINVNAGKLTVFYEMGMTYTVLWAEQSKINFHKNTSSIFDRVIDIMDYNFLFTYSKNRQSYYTKLRFRKLRDDKEYLKVRRLFGMTLSKRPLGVSPKEFAQPFLEEHQGLLFNIL